MYFIARKLNTFSPFNFFTKVTLLILTSLLFLSSNASATNVQHNYMWPMGCNPYIGEDCDVLGSSRLLRKNNGIQMQIWTSGLDPNHVYTVWWVIFNNPEQCGTTPCSEADLFNEPVETSVLNAIGHPAGDSGMGNFVANLKVQMPKDGYIKGKQVLFGPGLLDADKAEVHLVIQNHGPIDPEKLREQMTEFLGGCNSECEDIQFTVHEPTDE